MDEAAAVRRAARDAVEDVEPAPLREHIESLLADGSMVPGVLAILSASAAGDGGGPHLQDGTLGDPIAKRAAGVQLIYDGLRLTRRLSHEEPWAAGATDTDEADLAILAADVLVARGFYLLARTEAANTAVATVRAFGRDQTVRRGTDDDSLDRNLEADVLDLAVVAGTTLADGTLTPQLREYAANMANGSTFPAAAGFFPETVTETLGTLSGGGASGGVTTSADH